MGFNPNRPLPAIIADLFVSGALFVVVVGITIAAPLSYPPVVAASMIVAVWVAVGLEWLGRYWYGESPVTWSPNSAGLLGGVKTGGSPLTGALVLLSCILAATSVMLQGDSAVIAISLYGWIGGFVTAQFRRVQRAVSASAVPR